MKTNTMNSQLPWITSLTVICMLPWVQNIEISGRVTNAETGFSIFGGHVAVHKSLPGTFTDIDGKFTFNSSESLLSSLAATSVWYNDHLVEVRETGSRRTIFHHQEGDVDKCSPVDMRGENKLSGGSLNTHSDKVVITVHEIGGTYSAECEKLDLMEHDVHPLGAGGLIHDSLDYSTDLSHQKYFVQGITSCTGSSIICLNKIEPIRQNYFVHGCTISGSSKDSFKPRASGQLTSNYRIHDFRGDIIIAVQVDRIWFVRYTKTYNGNIETLTEGRYLLVKDAYENEKPRRNTMRFMHHTKIYVNIPTPPPKVNV